MMVAVEAREWMEKETGSQKVKRREAERIIIRGVSVSLSLSLPFSCSTIDCLENHHFPAPSVSISLSLRKFSLSSLGRRFQYKSVTQDCTCIEDNKRQEGNWRRGRGVDFIKLVQ